MQILTSISLKNERTASRELIKSQQSQAYSDYETTPKIKLKDLNGLALGNFTFFPFCPLKRVVASVLERLSAIAVPVVVSARLFLSSFFSLSSESWKESKSI